MTLRIHHGSILEPAVDVVATVANTRLQASSGLAAVVAGAAGPALSRECRAIGFCPIGEVAVTSGGMLRALYVIHIPTMDFEPWGRGASLEDVATATRAALQRCKELGGGSIAFPLLGAGSVGLPRRAVAETMAQAAAEHPDLEVVLCAFSPADRQAVEGLGAAGPPGSP